MKMISPTNREVDIGQTLADDEYIGMVRREVMDGFMRDRAIEKVKTIYRVFCSSVVSRTKVSINGRFGPSRKVHFFL